jgi:hypothetical protein
MVALAYPMSWNKNAASVMIRFRVRLSSGMARIRVGRPSAVGLCRETIAVFFRDIATMRPD